MDKMVLTAKWLGIIAAVPLATSCVTPPGAYSKVSKSDATLLSSLAQVQSNCASDSQQGQFLAELQATGIPGLTFEGLWTKSMSRLVADLTLPMGEPLARIELQDKESESKVTFPGMLQPRDEIANLGEFIEQIGASGLRLFLCGLHFVPEKGDSAFVPPELAQNVRIANVRTFWVRRNLRILAHKVNVTSDVTITNETGNRIGLVAESHLRSGFIMPSEIGTFRWVGYVQNKRVIPTAARIVVRENVYNLNFSEFE